MKTIDIFFRVKGSCMTTIEVPDNFKLSYTDSHEVWRRLAKKYPAHFDEVEELRGYKGFYNIDDGEMEIDNLEFDSIQGFCVTKQDKKEKLFNR